MAYEALAKYYDTLMDDVDYKDWAGYILKLLGESFGDIKENDVLVDAACGTGELACILKSIMPAKIIAIDNQEEMLHLAAEKARKRGVSITFSRQDLMDLHLPENISGLVCTCDGVNYLDGEGMKAFFSGVYTALKAGGVFLFDISSAYKLRDILGDNTIAEDREDIAFIWQNTLYESCVQIDLSIFERRGEVYIKSQEQQVQYIHEQDEVCLALSGAGFSKILVYGFSTFDRPEEWDERLQFVAIK